MSVLTLNVDEIMRTLSAESSNPFVVHDKEVDIVRFAINSGFADIVLDGQVALRVMYQRPGETEVRAQTLTYYDTDGLHNYYDWQLAQSDLAKNGSLMVALCILDISGGEVSEWHTTPCAVRVLSTIHTDDSDEADESITPTVAQRVAVLETMIQRVASGAPIVVASTSAMTDTSQIYVLSTNGRWYYHNGSAWVAGGEYGAVATDTTLTQSGIPADAKAVGDNISSLNESLDDKLDKQRQSSDAGKVLKINNNGEIVAGDVFNMRLATALISILKDIPYIEGNSKKYINGIISSLEDDNKSLMSISATYSAGSHTVYPWDSLDSLRDYLTVTAYYDDGSNETVTDYAIYGSLSTASSVVTVGYLTRTRNVTIQVEIDASLAYYITSGASLSGLDSINTDIMLNDADKSVTILGDVSDAEIATSLRTAMLISDRNASGNASYQVFLNTIEKSGAYVKKYSILGFRSVGQTSQEFSNAPHRIKFALIHYTNTTKCTVFLKVDDVVVCNWIQVNGAYVENTQPLFIGARPDGGYNWKGRINILNVYTRGLQLVEAKRLLGEEA